MAVGHFCKFGYKVVGLDENTDEGLPASATTPRGQWSVSTCWDYLSNAKYCCQYLQEPACVINPSGKVLFRNDVMKTVRANKFRRA